MTKADVDQIKDGLRYLNAGKLNEAEKFYRSYLANHPDNPEALNYMGYIEIQRGNIQLAIKLFKKAIKNSSDNPVFYNNYAMVCRSLGELEEARINFEKAIAINPDFYQANLNIAYLLCDINCNDEAVPYFKKVLIINPDDIGALEYLCEILANIGRIEESIEFYKKLLEKVSNKSKIHYSLGRLYHLVGQKQLAVNHFSEAISENPRYSEAYCSLGLVFADQNRTTQAVGNLHQAISIVPDYAEAHLILAKVYHSQGEDNNAIKYYTKALSINQKYAEAYCGLGALYARQNKFGEAQENFEKALELNPNYADTHYRIGNIFKYSGNNDDAIIHYKKAIEIQPDLAEAHRNIALIKPERDQISLFTDILSSKNLSELNQIEYHMALGSLYDQFKNYKKSFEHYQIGKTLARKSVSYSPVSYSKFINSLKNVYTKELVEKLSNFGHHTDLPVFIIGMPRSGTSLVEQIISYHPDVYGAGELGLMTFVEKKISENSKIPGKYPVCLKFANKSDIQNASEYYLNELRKYSNTSKRISDKMPHNFLRVGLIKILFPESHIIHCIRDPLDTCLSIFLNYFPQGHEYSFDLEELGKHYLDYKRIMEYWYQLFPSQILNVRYEELVHNQEKISQKISDYIGLDWDKKLLDFHNSKRPIRTASTFQARKPIYNSSIDRWRRYEKQIGPLISILEKNYS